MDSLSSSINIVQLTISCCSPGLVQLFNSFVVATIHWSNHSFKIIEKK